MTLMSASAQSLLLIQRNYRLFGSQCWLANQQLDITLYMEAVIFDEDNQEQTADLSNRGGYVCACGL